MQSSLMMYTIFVYILPPTIPAKVGRTYPLSSSSFAFSFTRTRLAVMSIVVCPVSGWSGLSDSKSLQIQSSVSIRVCNCGVRFVFGIAPKVCAACCCSECKLSISVSFVSSGVIFLSGSGGGSRDVFRDTSERGEEMTGRRLRCFIISRSFRFTSRALLCSSCSLLFQMFCDNWVLNLLALVMFFRACDILTAQRATQQDTIVMAKITIRAAVTMGLFVTRLDTVICDVFVFSVLLKSLSVQL